MNSEPIEELVLRELLAHPEAGDAEALRQVYDAAETDYYAIHNEVSESLGMLAQCVPQNNPPPQLKAKLMAVLFPSDDKVSMVSGAGLSSHWLSWPVLSAAALVLMLATASISRNMFQRQVQQKDLALAGLQTQLFQSREEVTQLSNPHQQVAHLHGSSSVPCQGHVFYNPESQKLICCIQGLTPLEQEQCYQLWYRDGAGFHAAGFLVPDETGHAVMRWQPDEPVSGLMAFAVSAEPYGGSPQPTGKVILSGEII